MEFAKCWALERVDWKPSVARMDCWSVGWTWTDSLWGDWSGETRAFEIPSVICLVPWIPLVSC